MDKALRFFIVSCLLPGTICFANCDDLHGLFEKRNDLVKRYSREIGTKYVENKLKADKYKKEIEAIDNIYRRKFHKLFDEYDQGEQNVFNECCENDLKAKDKYMFYVCKLIAYNHDKKDALFLNDIPADRDGLMPLWDIDPMIFSAKAYWISPHPRLFYKTTFAYLFLNTIYQLAVKDNVTAIDKFVNIEKFSDGEYGEYMEDKILSFFESHPNIVVKNWQIIKKYKATISFDTTDFNSKANNIISNYHGLCEKINTNPNVCKELIDFLQTKKQ